MSKTLELVDGKVVSATLQPETVTRPMARVLRTQVVTREPGGRIALIQLQLPKRKVELEIDEATARAIAKAFD